MATTNQDQHNFSKILPGLMHNLQGRQRQARTIVAVLQSYCQSDLSELSLLDVGCSTGIIADYLADFFGSVTAIDIDGPAINYAKSRFQKPNLQFLPGDLSGLSIRDGSTDVVVCAHVYEHVPDAVALFREIHRVLKPGGVCYFAAGNRLQVMEPQYRLPFLSVIPKSLGHVYMRVSGKGHFYYENHLSYWGLNPNLLFYKGNRWKAFHLLLCERKAGKTTVAASFC
jgi:2-polyprenyl-3-methyl-5-hydroxy-6-metoxy-1,4-benzoquinol methylase